MATQKTEGPSDLQLKAIASRDAEVVFAKNKEYGESWCKRGGQQAFAVIFRKTDRMESILEKMRNGYDIFEAWRKNPGDIRDDIRDMRRYLLLLEEYCCRMFPDTPEQWQELKVGQLSQHEGGQVELKRL